MPLPKLLANLSTRGRLAVGGAVLGVVVVALLLLSLASRPSWATLVTALDPAQTGKLTAALDERGVRYEIRNNGTALAVDKRDVAQARIAVAENGGVTGGTQQGFELFDSQKLGSSQMQQQVTYQRALEGELGRTIEQIDGVGGATVQLVLPDANDRLLSEDAPKPTAAVLLSGTSDPDPAAVRGIARLVASSVKALKPADVAITDGGGRLLWPTAGGEDGGGGSGGAATAKQLAAQRYQRQMESSLTSVLAQTVGPDKARVRVSADVDADEATQEQLRYGRRRVPLKEKTDDEQMEGGATAGGASGAAANVPGYAATGNAGGGDSRYRHRSGEREFGVDKTVTRRKLAAGGVRKQSVSVLVSDAVPAAQVPAIRDAVAAAAGIDRARGDQLVVSRLPFAKPPAPPAGATLPGGILSWVKWLVLALGTIAFLVLVARHLRRREREALAAPGWLQELDGPRPLRDFVPEPTVVTPVAEATAFEEPPALVASGARRQIEELAEREPARVAQQVRHWLAEE
ncbi:flagellar basal-body MS-ring/collar protein FliF [Patulibacter defluvii]|uniref:flagellar basal-body MS-ring/collar protein FliF n=1 Tax=Patulibacter defluvii TaxID=3095358 RepID=UPI002A75A5DA|nr:flagellar basal-body MS-ring/collar protein FliF [Patulibacter sp. DM4]